MPGEMDMNIMKEEFPEEITEEGREVLGLWIKLMEDNAVKLNNFVKMYKSKKK